MIIDVKKFAVEIEEVLAEGNCHWEIKMYAPGMLEEIRRSFSNSSVILTGQRILMHHFGEVLAARFKKWIDLNYEIGSDDREWSAGPVGIEEEMAA